MIRTPQPTAVDTPKHAPFGGTPESPVCPPRIRVPARGPANRYPRAPGPCQGVRAGPQPPAAVTVRSRSLTTTASASATDPAIFQPARWQRRRTGGDPRRSCSRARARARVRGWLRRACTQAPAHTRAHSLGALPRRRRRRRRRGAEGRASDAAPGARCLLSRRSRRGC